MERYIHKYNTAQLLDVYRLANYWSRMVWNKRKYLKEHNQLFSSLASVASPSVVLSLDPLLLLLEDEPASFSLAIYSHLENVPSMFKL